MKLPAAFGRPAPGAAALFALALALAAGFTLRAPVLNDTDSYFHLAIAREYAAHGMLHGLPQARFSLMRDGFGDKELLFHLALAPFAAGARDSTGGRLALALFVAAILTALGALARRAVGPWGYVVPFALLLLALDVPDRLNRLRPELFALLLLLAATYAAGRGRAGMLALAAFAFTLSYTAAQALAGLIVIWFVVRRIAGGRWEWRLLLWPLVAIGLALVVHPQFPKSLEVWEVVNVELFRLRDALDVGGLEIRPASTAELMKKNGAWFLAALLLALASRPRRAGDQDPGIDRAEAAVWASAALVFGLLYLLMWRFGVYFYALGTVAVLAGIAARGRTVGAVAHLPGKRRVPLALALGLVALAATPQAIRMAGYFLDRSAPGPSREREWAAFGAAVPPGARVAAPWGQAQAYLFWAPQATYLDFLDPIFMALPYPREYALQRALFAGEEPDVALAVARDLGSEYLALSRFLAPPRLLARLAADPRLEPVYAGYNLLFRVVPGRNVAFRTGWQLAGEGSAPPRPIERAASPQEHRLEAYVDAAPYIPAGHCGRFVGGERVARPARFELAPYGPAELAVDGAPRARVGASLGAVLGQGITFDLPAGEHRIEIVTCPDPATGRNGFFFRELGF